MRGSPFPFPLIFLLLFLCPDLCHQPWISGQTIPNPEPKIWIAQSHLGQQQFLQNQRPSFYAHEGEISVGQEYTLVLEMSILERWDFLVDSCTCNQRGLFMDRGGCLRRDANWLAKQEVRRDQTKYILIHFFAPEPILRIECQTRVVQCCGCCENYCERQMPSLEPYASFPVQIFCSYPVGLAPSAPQIDVPIAVPIVPAAALPLSCCNLPFINSQCSSSPLGGFPCWFLILLLFLFFLLPLCLCCLLVPFCLFAWGGRQRIRERIWPRKGQEEETHPPPPLPLPIPPPPPPISPPTQRNIYVVDSSSQTNHHSPLPPIPIPDYNQQQQQQQYPHQPKQRCRTTTPSGTRGGGEFEIIEHHAALPLQDSWWKVPPVTEWVWRQREEVEECEERQEEWTTTEEADSGRKSRMEPAAGGSRHYENWTGPSRYAGGSGMDNNRRNNNGWTHFVAEKEKPSQQQGEEVAGEDRAYWKTTTAAAAAPSMNGRGGETMREMDHRINWQRSAF